MGGFGSGRPGRRPVAEASLALPYHVLAPAVQRALQEQVVLQGSYTWHYTRSGEQCAAIGCLIFPTPHIELHYCYGETPITEALTLTKTPVGLHHAPRWWYACPHCQRRCSVLYGVQGRWRCRQCHHITYSSSCESDKRLKRVWEQLRDDGLPDLGSMSISQMGLLLKAHQVQQDQLRRKLARSAS